MRFRFTVPLPLAVAAGVEVAEEDLAPALATVLGEVVPVGVSISFLDEDFLVDVLVFFFAFLSCLRKSAHDHQ